MCFSFLGCMYVCVCVHLLETINIVVSFFFFSINFASSRIVYDYFYHGLILLCEKRILTFCVLAKISCVWSNCSVKKCRCQIPVLRSRLEKHTSYVSAVETDAHAHTSTQPCFCLVIKSCKDPGSECVQVGLRWKRFLFGN